MDADAWRWCRTALLGGDASACFYSLDMELYPHPRLDRWEQVLVSIRTKEVQNRVGQIIFRATDPSQAGDIHSISKNRWSGSEFISDSSFNVQGHTFSLQLLEVIRGGHKRRGPGLDYRHIQNAKRSHGLYGLLGRRDRAVSHPLPPLV